MFERAWEDRPGGAAATVLRARLRPANTQSTYDSKVHMRLEFNELGSRGVSYDPLVTSLDKFMLFAGWLVGTPAAPGRSTDKDLNGFRSAINRHLDDNYRGRPLVGPNFSALIARYRELQVATKPDADLNRVPCPEAVFMHLLRTALSSTDGAALDRIANHLLMLLGWFRADTMAGLRDGDVSFDAFGHLNVLIRHMKMRPEYRARPGLMTISPGPSASPSHTRCIVFWILQQALLRNPSVFSWVGRQVSPSDRNGETASMLLTADLRALCDAAKLGLPEGAVIGSHSWREMAAVSSHKAGYSYIRCCTHGHWREISTMFNSYIKPYLSSFPYSKFMAELFDFLRSH